jgi:ornithine carbamoyltransferase
VRHLLSIADLDPAHLRALVDRSVEFAAGRANGARPLRDRVVGVYFAATSTRTRTAFSSGAVRLGGSVIAYGPNDLQLNTGETIEDTAKVFASMLDVLVVRAPGDTGQLAVLADQDRMAVINAMSPREHPTQAVADLATMSRRFGRVDGLRVLYVGEGNNSAAALALALARFPDVELHLRTPPGYGLAPDVLDEARVTAKAANGLVTERHDLDDLPTVDVVYTTRWQTTGTSKPDPDWRSVFAPFQVDAELMAATGASTFMHDLPAHRGEEVTAAVLDGPASIAFEQAENKMHSARAVLEWCVSQP